jgi:hypothetical protein
VFQLGHLWDLAIWEELREVDPQVVVSLLRVDPCHDGCVPARVLDKGLHVDQLIDDAATA